MNRKQRIRQHTDPPWLRPSFTLVELLIVVAIIAFMSGLLLFTLAGAQNDARRAKTRSTISKLNEIILQHWEEYRYRPTDVRLPAVATAPIPGSTPPRYPVSPRENARLRMVVLRDTMRMEMPDRITDVLYGPTQYTVVYETAGTNLSATKITRVLPAKAALIYNKLRNNIIEQQNQGNPAWNNFALVATPASIAAGSTAAPTRYATGTVTDADWRNRVSSAELLYLIIATSQFSGSSALEYFKPSEVADIDGDGLLEFIDAWGNPIGWVRWPAGYPGDLVQYADDDAMDPLKTDWRYELQSAQVWQPKTLVPLILSAGPDGVTGIIGDFDVAGVPFAYANMTWPGTASAGEPAGTRNTVGGAFANNTHYAAGTYYYPDPNFVVNGSNVPNGSGRVLPSGSNQLGGVQPGFEDFVADNVTNHDIILEP